MGIEFKPTASILGKYQVAVSKHNLKRLVECNIKNLILVVQCKLKIISFQKPYIRKVEPIWMEFMTA